MNTVVMFFLVYLLLISIATFAFYAYDKKQAIKNGRRVPEATLHLLELLGGSLAAFFAQRKLRHKNRKKSYQLQYWSIVAIHVVLVAGFIYVKYLK